MSIFDWLVLTGTLAFIVIYGVWKTRGSKDVEGYLLGDTSMKWWTICLSIMATQASAITFLSTPGQAYEDGMRFIQFYFGLPIAMVIISIVAVPLYAKLKVYTAYEYLESRFDLKTRLLTALLFLIQRGLAAGITIYAPSIILSALLGWNLELTNIIIGSLVILYTVSGGTKAVSVTQKQQMAVMMGGMIIAGIVVLYKLPPDISFMQSVELAGKLGKMNLVDFSFDLENRYNFWSGITGGLFLALSYFGTDQSQVGRYLSGKSVTESRLGLLFNGLLKIPMQFIILFIGVLVFLFYQFQQPPVFFNKQVMEKVYHSPYRAQVESLAMKYEEAFEGKKKSVSLLSEAMKRKDEKAIEFYKGKTEAFEKITKDIRSAVKSYIVRAVPDAELKDTDYVFLTFVMNNLPAGLVGLLLAVIFSAAMSSTSAELNALSSTTTVDIYKRIVKKDESDTHYLNASRWFTLLWGVLGICFALSASLFENLIQLVNWLGSMFYGTILGVFVCAFFFRYIRSTAVFIAAIISEAIVLICYFTTDISFLLYNVIGCVLVVGIGFMVQPLMKKTL